MKILLLADTYSEHTEKWALGLASRGIEVGLFSFNKASYPWYENTGIKVLFEPDEQINAESLGTKLSYLRYVSELRRAIHYFKPDILHAHYASSYGLVGAISGFHPFALSVWGSDVYHFPVSSPLHKWLFSRNLRKADRIFSTSHIMRQEILKYTDKTVTVTPFGVNTTVFSPTAVPDKRADTVYVGTIKPIEEKYGIVYIIEAAALLVKRYPEQRFKFMLIGAGSSLDEYRQIADRHGLAQQVEITGRVPFSKISQYHNLLDIFLNVSIDDSESFGVAAVEAMACEKPVIVTDVGGLMEVVQNGEFGLVIPKRDPEAIASAIEKVMNDPEGFAELGRKARKHVVANYDWENNLDRMITEYKELLHAS